MKTFHWSCVLLTLSGVAMTALWIGHDSATSASAGEKSVSGTAIPLATLGAAALGAAEGYGSVTGQYVVEGAIPKLAVKVKAKDASAKDAAVCAATDIPDESLVVDAETKGVSNVFIFLRKAAKIHPDLKASTTKEVTFDQKGCRFIPHALFVRTDQVVKILSDDAVSHNAHATPTRNQQFNQAISPNDRKGLPYQAKVAESAPSQVKCDIHPWMSAYWLILDHPYAAITGPDGKFQIENLPVGDHEFSVWHERGNFLDRKLKVTVKAGSATDLGTIKIPVAKLGGG